MATVLGSMHANSTFHRGFLKSRCIFRDLFVNYSTLRSCIMSETYHRSGKRSIDRRAANSVSSRPVGVSAQIHSLLAVPCIDTPSFLSTASQQIVGRSGLFNDHLTDSRFSIMYSQRRMAGHNKWSNIKHIKGAKDAAKSLQFQRISRLIKLSMQGGKSNDPRFNTPLAHAVDAAKQANMPVAKIDALLKSSEGNKETMIPFSVEARGPGGCFLIVETLTDNVNRTKANVKFLLTKHGAATVDSVKHIFDYKGTINIDASTSKLNTENAVELAIEVGAEDVIQTSEDDGQEVFQFQCDPKDYLSVKTELSTRGYDLKSAGLNFIPKIKAPLSDEQLEVMSKLFEVLNEHPDVVKIYENVA